MRSVSWSDFGDDVIPVLVLENSGCHLAANGSLHGANPPGLGGGLLCKVVVELGGIYKDLTIVPLCRKIRGRNRDILPQLER